MDKNSKKQNISEKDKEYLNQESHSDKSNVFSAALKGGGDALKGLAESQSSEAIKIDENEIKDIKEKVDKDKEITSEEQTKLSIHDIQSGKFRNFFSQVDSTNLTSNKKSDPLTEIKNKLKDEKNEQHE